MRFVRVGSCDLVDRAYSSGQRSDPRNHIYEEVVGVKRKVKTHFTADAQAPSCRSKCSLFDMRLFSLVYRSSRSSTDQG